MAREVASIGVRIEQTNIHKLLLEHQTRLGGVQVVLVDRRKEYCCTNLQRYSMLS